MTDYRKMIEELLDRIQNQKVLKIIYEFVHHMYIKGGE
jgi:hypothetical protein